MATPEYHIVSLGRNLRSTIVGLGLGINRPGTDKEGKGTRDNHSSTSLQRRHTSSNHTSSSTANRRHRRRRRSGSETAPTATSRSNHRGSIVLLVATNDDRIVSSRGTRHRETGTTASTKLLVRELVDTTSALASRMAFRRLALILAARHCGKVCQMLDGKSFADLVAFIEVSAGKGGNPLYILVLKYI
jgi:hypothetical protein